MTALFPTFVLIFKWIINHIKIHVDMDPKKFDEGRDEAVRNERNLCELSCSNCRDYQLLRTAHALLTEVVLRQLDDRNEVVVYGQRFLSEYSNYQIGDRREQLDNIADFIISSIHSSNGHSASVTLLRYQIERVVTRIDDPCLKLSSTMFMIVGGILSERAKKFTKREGRTKCLKDSM